MKSLSEYEIGDLVEPPYFEGVFTSAPQNLGPDPWISEGWIKNCEALASSLELTRFRRGGLTDFFQRPLLRRTIKRLLYGHPDFPSHLVDFARQLARMAAIEKISIIDIGGGFGDNYFYLTEVLKPAELENIDYHVVDNERSIALGTKLFQGRQLRPTFHNGLPPHSQFDVTLLVGTLHYVSDWQSFLGNLKNMTSKKLMLARSPISPDRTFFTQQTICPPLGELRDRKAGVSAVQVVSETDLVAALTGTGGWRIEHRKHQQNYRHNFLRLDPAYQDVAYVNFIFARTNGTRVPT